jgi:KEOPS complex subunit Cgi121
VVAVVVGEGDREAAAADLRDLLIPAETLGAYDEERVREFFDVTDTELAATEGTLADAVRERVALLPVEK